MANLNVEEMTLLRGLPDKEQFEFCLALDLIPDEGFDIEELAEGLLDRLAERLPGGAVPISRYDTDALLESSGPESLRRLARGMGLRWIPSNPALLAGRIARVSKRRCKELSRDHPLRWCLPLVLHALVRRLPPAG